MAGQFALADSTTDIVDALVSKGVLTEEEGKLISKGHTSKTEKTPVIKEKDGAFSIESPNGRNTMQVGGRIHFDSHFSDVEAKDLYQSGRGAKDFDTKSLADGFEIRRARLAVKGQFAKDFDYLIQGNLIGGSGSNIVDEAYFGYKRFEGLSLRVGKFKQPFGLEQLTSSNNIDFMERSFNDQLVPAKKMGAMLFGAPATGFTYAASIYQKNDDEADMQTDSNSYAGRATYNFAEMLGNKDAVMHVGLAGRDETYSMVSRTSGNESKDQTDVTRGTVFSFRSGGRGLQNMYRAQLAGTAVTNEGYNLSNGYSNTVTSRAIGLEAIGAYGPFKLQGEYATTGFDAVSGDNSANKLTADVRTYYAEAMWILTGEKYADAYKKGVFGALKPKNDFDLDSGNLGLWELGFRVDGFSVDNATIQGSSTSRFQGSTQKTAGHADSYNTVGTPADGGAKSYTAGLKWILNPNTRVMLNYTYTSFDYDFAPIDIDEGTKNKIKSEKVLGVRTQLMF
jgi:phosphate-selective porin OprO/OprP